MNEFVLKNEILVKGSLKATLLKIFLVTRSQHSEFVISLVKVTEFDRNWIYSLELNYYLHSREAKMKNILVVKGMGEKVKRGMMNWRFTPEKNMFRFLPWALFLREKNLIEIQSGHEKMASVHTWHWEGAVRWGVPLSWVSKDPIMPNSP